MCPAVPMVAELVCPSVVCALGPLGITILALGSWLLEHRILVYFIRRTVIEVTDGQVPHRVWIHWVKGQVRSQVGGRGIARDSILQLGLMHTLNLLSICF